MKEGLVAMDALLDVFTHASPAQAIRLLTISGLKVPKIISHDPQTSHVVELKHWYKKTLNGQQRAIGNTNGERITTMTDDLGYQALLAEAAHCGDLSGDLTFSPEAKRHNRYDLAIGMFEIFPEAYRRAEHARHASYYREGRSWSCYRTYLPMPFSDQISLEQFEILLRKYFELDEGDDELLVDVFPRIETGGVVQQWQVVVYRDGVPKHYKELDKRRKTLIGGVYKPVREYSLLYTPKEGMLEVISNRRTDREELGNIFARTVLGLKAPLRPIIPASLNLDLFLERPALDFRDDCEIEDEIEWVAVTGISLESIHSPGKVDILPSTTCAASTDAYRFLDLHELASLVRHGGFRIKSIRLSIAFRNSDDGQRAKETIHFSLTTPNKCNLKPHSARHRYIRQVLLPRWELFQDEVAL